MIDDHTHIPSPEDLDPTNWVKDHGDYLFRFALVRLKDRAAAEDAVQETFLAGMKAIERFDKRKPIRAWLTGILKFKVVDRIRIAAREFNVEDDEQITMMTGTAFRYFGIPDRQTQPLKFDPRHALEQKEFMTYFTKCLAGLDDRLNAVFVLREIEGESTEFICKELSISANNLWVILHRARQRLRMCLELNWLRKESCE
jgi:RNA polymerase sigma-70 factor, ECF subfamily